MVRLDICTCKRSQKDKNIKRNCLFSTFKPSPPDRTTPNFQQGAGKDLLMSLISHPFLYSYSTFFISRASSNKLRTRKSHVIPSPHLPSPPQAGFTSPFPWLLPRPITSLVNTPRIFPWPQPGSKGTTSDGMDEGELQLHHFRSRRSIAVLRGGVMACVGGWTWMDR